MGLVLARALGKLLPTLQLVVKLIMTFRVSGSRVFLMAADLFRAHRFERHFLRLVLRSVRIVSSSTIIVDPLIANLSWQ